MAISMFDTRTMLAALEQMPLAKTFLRDTFFRSTKLSDTIKVDVDVYKGKRRIPVYVSPLEEGKVVARDGFTTSTYEPPYIKEKRVTTAADAMTRRPGETIYPNSMSPADRAAEILAKDLTELDEIITRGEELQAAQALFTGELIVRNSAKITFPLASDHKITLEGTALWSDTTNSDPRAKIREWRRKLIQDSGLNPDIIVLGSSAADYFLAHPKVKDSLNMLKVNNGQIVPANLPNGVTYWGYLADAGVDVYTYDEWYLDSNGVEQPMVPVKKVLMGSTRARMDRCYGAIQDLSALYAVPRFPKSWEEEDPSARFLMMQSAPLLVPTQVDSFLFAQVLT